MSIQAVGAAINARGHSPTEKLVMIALANYADADARCYPSHRKLADDTGLTDRTIRATLKALAERGTISRTERERTDGSRTTDIITLNFIPEANSGGTETASGGVRKDVPGGTETASGREPSSNHQGNQAALAGAEPLSDFDLFWANYPRKVGKDKAREAYAKAIDRMGGPDPPAIILAALAFQTDWWADNDFTPHPTTWLNQGRWQDETPPRIEKANNVHRFDKSAAYLDNLKSVDAAMAEAVRQRTVRLGGG